MARGIAGVHGWALSHLKAVDWFGFRFNYAECESDGVVAWIVSRLILVLHGFTKDAVNAAQIQC